MRKALRRRGAAQRRREGPSPGSGAVIRISDVDEESPQLVAGLGAFAAIVVAAALVPLRDWLGSTNVALILAIVVVVAATFGGRLAGIVTSIAAAASFDFFHTKPYLTLTIDKREDVIAAVLLLVMGVIVGELAMLRLASRREALDHAAGASRLEDVAAIVAAGADVDEVWPVVRQSLVDAAPAAGVPLRAGAVRHDAHQPRQPRPDRQQAAALRARWRLRPARRGRRRPGRPTAASSSAASSSSRRRDTARPPRSGASPSAWPTSWPSRPTAANPSTRSADERNLLWQMCCSS